MRMVILSSTKASSKFIPLNNSMFLLLVVLFCSCMDQHKPGLSSLTKDQQQVQAAEKKGKLNLTQTCNSSRAKSCNKLDRKGLEIFGWGDPIARFTKDILCYNQMNRCNDENCEPTCFATMGSFLAGYDNSSLFFSGKEPTSNCLSNCKENNPISKKTLNTNVVCTIHIDNFKVLLPEAQNSDINPVNGNTFTSQLRKSKH